VARTQLDRADVARCWAGFAAVGSGLVHLAQVRSHLESWWPVGVGCLLLGVAQVGWALVALARTAPPLPRVASGTCLAVVAVSAASWTTGLPLGPGAGRPHLAGTADLLATALAALVVLALLGAGPRHAGTAPDRATTAAGTPGRERLSAPATRLALLAVGALAVASLTTPALAATEAGGHAHPHLRSATR
jgi:hypothetical protein